MPLANREIYYLQEGDPRTCRRVLDALPDWFAIESSRKEYVEQSRVLPMLVMKVDGFLAGFLSIKYHNQASCEIYVMGVLPGYHRSGVGTELIKELEVLLIRQGCKLLHVKTLSPAKPCEFYDKTRSFYKSVGFLELERDLSIWGPENLCSIMAKAL